MPNGAGGTIDVTGDVDYMFGQFNAVAAASPLFYTSGYPQADVFVYPYAETGIVARGGAYDTNGDGIYDWGELKLSTSVSWGNSSSNRATLCHETDHLMGLHHVWDHGADGIDNVGSKATCIGNGYPTGPYIDDVSALSAVYSGTTP
jgi:hypothetical protein